MREVRMKVPEGSAREFVMLARDAGIERVGVYREFVHGLEQHVAVVSIETSTPAAERFVARVQQPRVARHRVA